ncbi:uncharacterized protein LOC109534662 [Dendroctonus ponderosae]|uniref:MH2 domain-containing protein n=2 Tax=Dendroctonus ponderosae TaxID=77166 RepID=A0AAR5P4D5_DENPD|nr:uncharacterized protein LOC109534662 [Dendroctonus ponderosae]XP_019755965.1 uncharacterized protein LOC109534662 [Dendroctonus ponderosae]XP_048524465.1 uncharacterized protein LOC109534662 [Dendroctonus ponderosae]
MVSRKKILSKSRDDINLLSNPQPEDSEDVWYQKEKLFKDHIQEVLNKWNQIDDEIWAKVVVLERNRRVAKAYARAPVLTVNGSDSGFDGFRIGLSGFENPLRDKKTEECRRHIGHGVKIKMDEDGNILIKRLSRANVFIRRTTLDEESAISNEVLKLSHGALEANKAFTLFDMNKFQINVTNELKRSYPNRRRLENQCLSAICFVKNDSDLLKSPIWMLIINMVAIDMLKSQIPLETANSPQSLPVTLPLEEENYSVCANAKNGKLSTDNHVNGSSNSSSNEGSYSSGTHRDSGKRELNNPPELPPRKKLEPCNIPQPDYQQYQQQPPASSIRRIPSKKHKNKVKKLKKQPDDPYYCGMKARIPNFVAKLTRKKFHQPNCKQYQQQVQQQQQIIHNQPIYGYHQPHYQPTPMEQHVRRVSQVKHPNVVPSALWSARSLDSGLDTAGSSQSPYNNYTMFYRFQAQPSRGYIPVPPGTVYIGEWD